MYRFRRHSVLTPAHAVQTVQQSFKDNDEKKFSTEVVWLGGVYDFKSYYEPHKVPDLHNYTKNLALMYAPDKDSGQAVMYHKSFMMDPDWRGAEGRVNGPGARVLLTFPTGEPEFKPHEFALESGVEDSLAKLLQFMPEHVSAYWRSFFAKHELGLSSVGPRAAGKVGEPARFMVGTEEIVCRALLRPAVPAFEMPRGEPVIRPVHSLPFILRRPVIPPVSNLPARKQVINRGKSGRLIFLKRNLKPKKTLHVCSFDGENRV